MTDSFSNTSQLLIHYFHSVSSGEKKRMEASRGGTAGVVTLRRIHGLGPLLNSGENWTSGTQTQLEFDSQLELHLPTP